MTKTWDATSEHLLRELAPQVLGAVARRFRDFSSAEDAVQEAMIAAFSQWPQEGVPENPRGWLIQVACRRMTDQVRSEIARRERETVVAAETANVASLLEIEADMDPDDTLILLFTCCHPALTPSSAIVLTLRAVGGLTTAEIANAFLVPEATMAQRISRAKQTIKASGTPFRLPSRHDRAGRLPAVLHVLYLIFSEGYTSSIGPHLQRFDLAREAIRLTRNTKTLLPENAEVAGLLALMLLTDARRTARTGPDEELIPLDKQDRSLWDHVEISEGIALLTAALAKGAVGLYQLQAAIYELLKRVSPSPMVTLNHAIAAAMVHGPADGLQLLRALDTDPRVATHYRLAAVRAHLLEQTGDYEAAIEHYRIAAARTTSIPERNYLMTQAARLAGD
jgi:RNA polymerase sigma factor (sigma-70 family)